MADTTVKIFDSSMAGAPTLSNAAGSLIAVLDACLVNGFGLKTVDSLVVSGGLATANISTGHSAVKDSVVLIAGATPAGLNGEKKVISVSTNTVVFDATGISNQTATGTISLKMAPAGWTKAFAGTNKAAYKSANAAATGLLVRIDDTGSTDARVVGYETMTDVDTGTNAFPTSGQQTGGLYWPKANNGTGTRKWWIAANDRFVYVGIAYNITYPDDYVPYGFGDIVGRKTGDAYKMLVNGYATSLGGGNPATSVATLFAKGSSGVAAITLARSYNQMGSAILSYLEWGGGNTAYVSGAGPKQFPNGPDNGLLLEAITVIEGSLTSNRGYLPGVLACHQTIAEKILNDQSLPAIPQFPNRNFVWKILGSTSPTSRGGFALDITGPWAS